MRGSSALEPVGGSRDGDSRRRGKQLVDAEGRPAAASQLERVEAPVVLRERAGIPSPPSNAASNWRFTASWLTTTAVPPRLRRAMSVRPCTARSRTTGSGSTPTRHRRSPLGDYRLPVDARPLSVVPVKQARVGCHTTAGTLGDRLRGLPRPQQRAGDDGGHVAARRRPEPPGL
jgi:hypothetical protein